MAKKITKDKQMKMDSKISRSISIKKARKNPSFNIAAFDQATLCGVAFQLNGEEPKVELWDLSIKAKESQGMKWIRFETRFREFVSKNKIQILAYELPAGRNINPIIHSSKLIGIMEKVCTELEIEYMECPTTEIKKFATGNGVAGKPLMIQFAKQLWGYKGENDNEADALHILHFLKSKIN